MYRHLVDEIYQTVGHLIGAGHMKFSGTHWKCIEYLTSLVPLIDEKYTVSEWTCF